MTGPNKTSVETVAELLAEHEYALNLKSSAICRCGFVPTVKPDSLLTQQDYHRAHVAAAVEQILAAREAALLDGLRAVATDSNWSPTFLAGWHQGMTDAEEVVRAELLWQGGGE